MTHPQVVEPFQGSFALAPRSATQGALREPGLRNKTLSGLGDNSTFNRFPTGSALTPRSNFNPKNALPVGKRLNARQPDGGDFVLKIADARPACGGRWEAVQESTA